MENHPVYIDNDPQSDHSTLNLGPTHPATHGVFQNVLQMDGERIISGVSTIGYIHRAFEKIAEHRPFYQITPLTDRLNYCSSPINNMGWHMTVEKLLNIQTPKRVDYLRVIVMELARIADHIVCNGVLGVDTGAFTGFLYMMEFRESIYEIYEEVCGSRLTTNIGRIGGFERNFNTKAFAKLRKFLVEFPKTLKEFEALFTRNRIFVDRTKGVAAVTAEDALSYSWSGPLLRAAGVDYDVRAMNPYSSYEDFDFEVPVGENGDVYARFLVRNEARWDPVTTDDLLRERAFKGGPVKLSIDPPSAGAGIPMRIIFGREPVDKPFVLTMGIGEDRVAIRADGIGHFVVE